MSPRTSASPIRRLNGDGTPVYLAIASRITSAGESSKPSDEIMHAVNLSTGKPWCVVADAVLAGELRSNYPRDSYVGKSFEVRKYKPKGGKRYATFAISEIILEDPIQEATVTVALEKLAAELQHDVPATVNRPVLIDHPLALPYDEYLSTALWRKIRRRILKRDERLCRRCGGEATQVHHRSYSDEVMLGNDDEGLAAICEGCHTIIHSDESGKKRSEEETDGLLMQKFESADFPPPRVDLRRSRRRQFPPEWPRMTAIQRNAYDREYERLKLIRRCQSGRSSVAFRTILRSRHGMDEAAIDAALYQKPSKRKA